MAIDGEASPIGSRSWKIQGKEKDKSFNPKQTAQSVPPPIGENSEEENLRIRCRNPCCGAGVCRTGGSCWSGKPLEGRLGFMQGEAGGGDQEKRRRSGRQKKRSVHGEPCHCRWAQTGRCLRCLVHGARRRLVQRRSFNLDGVR